MRSIDLILLGAVLVLAYAVGLLVAGAALIIVGLVMHVAR